MNLRAMNLFAPSIERFLFDGWDAAFPMSRRFYRP
jgi:hypothetical protein